MSDIAGKCYRFVCFRQHELDALRTKLDEALKVVGSLTDEIEAVLSLDTFAATTLPVMEKVLSDAQDFLKKAGGK